MVVSRVPRVMRKMKRKGGERFLIARTVSIHTRPHDTHDRPHARVRASEKERERVSERVETRE